MNYDIKKSGERIHQLRIRAGYTQGELASKLRSCIHKRLSKVWKWEILTIASAEEREIS